MLKVEPPALTVSQQDPLLVSVRGSWHVHALTADDTLAHIKSILHGLPAGPTLKWDLSGIDGLDHIGAQLLWNAWGKMRPAQLTIPAAHESVFVLLERATASLQPLPPRPAPTIRDVLAARLAATSDQAFGFLALVGQLVLDLWQFASQPRRGPWKEISANIFHIGYQALGITALVGLLIGVVLSYLSAQQLHTFGGDIYLVNILGMSIIRELGPMLAAILVAGRSGSAITAQLGVMRVTEELDAMLVMGMPHGFRLVMPKVIALAISMPLLVIWTDAMALLGGMFAAKVELGLAPSYFLQKLPEAVSLVNYWIGLGKGVIFGSLIALVACHFGLRIKANTESLGEGTTTSVVMAITIVIMADAVFAIVFSNIGY
ncbi:MAG TPA: ABC transporter permease [Burkholderiaceae bacterium]|jgi:phospholipid/cholesterol/gamma-HCH transport system permease protein|nr:ABC transporter permease [Burkholderiaceae bacterium]